MASDPQQNINDVMAIISLAIKTERVGSGVYVTSFDSSGHSDPVIPQVASFVKTRQLGGLSGFLALPALSSVKSELIEA